MLKLSVQYPVVAAGTALLAAAARIDLVRPCKGYLRLQEVELLLVAVHEVVHLLLRQDVQRVEAWVGWGCLQRCLVTPKGLPRIQPVISNLLRRVPDRVENLDPALEGSPSSAAGPHIGPPG